MKVLYVITKSNWGGAQRYVYDLATNIRGEKCEVAVAAGGDGVLIKKLKDADIQTFGIPSFERDIKATKEFRAALELARIVRTWRPEVVHLNSSKAGGTGALVALLLGVPKIVFTAHGWPFMEKRNFLWRTLAWLGSWVTAVLSHRVIVVSKNDLRFGQKFPFCATKMHLIYNGIDLETRFASGEKIRSAFPPNAHITGTIGELTHNKNQISLVEQARKDPNMYVAIVGEGEERQRLEAKIAEYGLSDRVKLFGFLYTTDVMRGFDVFSLPSLKEGLPYVLLEAKAAGLPIVANRVGGVGEILDAKDMKEFSLENMLRKTVEIYRSD